MSTSFDYSSTTTLEEFDEYFKQRLKQLDEQLNQLLYKLIPKPETVNPTLEEYEYHHTCTYCT